MSQIESTVAEFLRIRDHAYAVHHPEEEQTSQSCTYALEWLFDACLENIQDADDSKRRNAEMVRYHY